MDHNALQQALEQLPHGVDFRFVDRLTKLNPGKTGKGEYTVRGEAPFLRGHFPGNPVTPGVLLVEAMAQAAVVAHGIHLVTLEGDDPAKLLTFFTDAQVEFSGMVPPGARVTISGRKLFWRRRKLRSEAEMRLEDGSVVCSGTLAGMGVPR